jgi:hypothetical protein
MGAGSVGSVGARACGLRTDVRARVRGGGRCVQLVGSVAWLVSWSGSSLGVMNSIYI